MTYIAIFKDKKPATFNTLEEIQQLPYVEYIFKKELFEEIPNTTFNGYPITHYSYSYTPIDFDGNKKIIKKGNFELIDIGPDNRYYKTFKGRTLKLYDHFASSLRETVSMTESEDFIIKDLLPMLDALELTNSWDIYLELEDAKKLKVLVEKQKSEIQNLNTKIRNLETEINRLTQLAEK